MKINNFDISKVVEDLTDSEKLSLYQFLLNLHNKKTIYKVNYKLKPGKSQEQTAIDQHIRL